jgi:cytochrome P450
MTEVSPAPWYMRRQNEFDPDSHLGDVRREEGVVRLPIVQGGAAAWLVTRLSDARSVLADHRRFSSMLPPKLLFAGMGMGDRVPSEEEVAGFRAGNLVSLDAPDHTRLRRKFASAFTAQKMRALEQPITQIIEEHLDEMERGGAPVDLVQAFTQPVPSQAIWELLGVPREDRAEFQRWSNELLDVSLPPQERQKSLGESRNYMAGFVDGVMKNPGLGLLGSLVREHGDELTHADLTGIGNALLIAGHLSVANTLGLGALALLRHPDQLRIVRDQPEHIDTAVEELLRWLSAVSTTNTRVATEDVEIAGVRIAAGDLVLVSLPTVNRAPELVPNPDVLDVTRRGGSHVAFGHGVHYCLGAPMARLELRLALPALFRRFPNLRLAEPDAPIEMRGDNFVHGPVRMAVVW